MFGFLSQSNENLQRTSDSWVKTKLGENLLQTNSARIIACKSIIIKQQDMLVVLCCAQSLSLCPTLCNPMECSMPGSSVQGDSPGKNNGVGYHSLLQGIFPTQGPNPGLPHCGQILYHLATREAQEYWSGQTIPSPGDLPDPGIEPRSPAQDVLRYLQTCERANVFTE